jgi:Predicted membrane protein (DUF2339)
MPLLILLAVLYGLVLLATPVLAIFLLVRYANLRKELNDFTAENAKQLTKLQRVVGELQNKIAASSAPATPAREKPATPEVRQTVPVPRSFPGLEIPAPVAVPPPVKAQPPVQPPPAPSIPASEKKPESAPEQKPRVPAPAAPVPPVTVTPPIAPPAARPQKPPAPVAPVEPKPVAPVTPPAAIPPAAARRISTPAPISPLRVPAPKPTLQQRMKKVSGLEEALGANWFAKLGVAMTVIGVALLGMLVVENLGPAGKAFIVFAVAIVLLVGGIFVEKLEKYRLLGRGGIGGGWALLFFFAYGIHHVAAMQVLDSLVLDCILMLAVALGMAAHTLRYKSQFVTGFAFLLGYTTVALSFSDVQPLSSAGTSEATVYGLIAGVILSISLVTIVLKMGWFELEVFGILSSYLNHLYWLYRLLGIQGAHGRSFPEFHASLAMLFFYWLTFRVSYVTRAIKTDFEEHVSTVAAVLNTFLLLGVMKFQSARPELAYLALFAVGAFEFAAAQLPVMNRRRRAFVLLSVMGAALMLAAVPSHYSGNNVAILWLVGAEVFLAGGIIFEEVVFWRLGLFTGLLVGIDLIGFNFRPLVDLRAKSEELALATGVLFALCAVVFYINGLHVASRWEKFFTASLDGRLLTIHSYLGAFSAAVAAWALFANDWTALAFAAIMLLLAAFGRRLESRHLQIQYALLGLLVLYRAIVFNLHIENPAHGHITTRLITLPLLGATFYLTAKLAALSDDQGQRVFRGLFSFAGTFLFALLIWSESPETWMAVLFLTAGMILALVGRRWNLADLAFHEHLLAIAAILRTLDYNNYLTGHYGLFSLRLITASIVAAGLYAISRKATTEDAPHALASAYLHTTAATSLLALLMWYELSTGWLAAFWAMFAFVLAAVDRRFQLDDLRWQAHALAALTMLRSVGINMYVEETWHGVSVRLLSLSIVAVLFYAMSRFIRMPEQWRARDFHHIYSWCASLIVSLLLWHELRPLSIAVGIAAFGLVLFEYGLLRKIAQFRYQAYVAFTAAFARIFFSNLTADEPGVFWGPRVFTVVPLAMIFFFVYAQLTGKEENTAPDRRFRFDALVAYLGTATVSALFYFQLRPEWVVTAYAVLAFALFAAAWAMDRPVFLHQGMLLTLGTFARGMAHNLFGASYFAGGDWKGRYFVVGSAVAILLSTLFFAFSLRGPYPAPPNASGWRKAVSGLVARPEQLQFFIPIILLTTMLALKMREGMVTVSWGIEGVLIILLALAVKERSFRLTGLGILVLCVAKVLGMDAWRLEQRDRYITFIIVGVALIAVSSLYIRFRDNIRHYL